jgi:hypothetical protein
LAAAALAAAVLVAGAASAVILAAGSGRPPLNPGSPNSTASSTSQKSTSISTSTTPTTAAAPNPPAQAALAAVSTYWEAIGRHEFGAAYAVLAPGAVPQTGAQWASAEQSTGVESVRFKGEADDASGTEATVTVLSLVTVDQRFGCRSWTGAYRMTSRGGHWLIVRADITPRPCAVG